MSRSVVRGTVFTNNIMKKRIMLAVSYNEFLQLSERPECHGVMAMDTRKVTVCAVAVFQT